MDDTVTRLAREMADAIAALVAADPRIEACRERARAAGYEMHVSLEAVVGFAARHAAGAHGPRDRAKRGGPGGIRQAAVPTAAERSSSVNCSG